MATCINCGRSSRLISNSLGVCVDCIRGDFGAVRSHIEEVHHLSRREFGLPEEPPRDAAGVPCTLCVNGCRIPEGGRGYCGLRVNEGGRIVGGGPEDGNLSWYYDPLPTNCVASWACPAETSAGYPEFTDSRGPEYSYRNLAVFYQACSFDCLFCQNWHYREETPSGGRVSAEELARCVDERTRCICYFGGDPTPQLLHSIRASEIALEGADGRILRICWETNGAMSPELLDRIADIALRSGGCIKFDLKAWSEELAIALCGVTNRRTLENFRRAALMIRGRPDPPLLVASTLLVPGYVDATEVKNIAGFIASLDPDIPYSLLAFHPHFYMGDLPTTSAKHAKECMDAALSAGLKRIRIGNVHLLGNSY